MTSLPGLIFLMATQVSCFYFTCFFLRFLFKQRFFTALSIKINYNSRQYKNIWLAVAMFTWYILGKQGG